MNQCPKCGYERKPGDTECPQCGIVYEKYEALLAKKQAEEEKREQEEAERIPEAGWKKKDLIKIVSTIAIFVFVIFFLFLIRQYYISTTSPEIPGLLAKMYGYSADAMGILQNARGNTIYRRIKAPNDLELVTNKLSASLTEIKDIGMGPIGEEKEKCDLFGKEIEYYKKLIYAMRIGDDNKFDFWCAVLINIPKRKK